MRGRFKSVSAHQINNRGVKLGEEETIRTLSVHDKRKIHQGILDLAEDFAEKAQPVYKLLNWGWARNVNMETGLYDKIIPQEIDIIEAVIDLALSLMEDIEENPEYGNWWIASGGIKVFCEPDEPDYHYGIRMEIENSEYLEC